MDLLPKKKSHLKSGLNQRSRAKSAASYIKVSLRRRFFSFPGLCNQRQHGNRGRGGSRGEQRRGAATRCDHSNSASAALRHRRLLTFLLLVRFASCCSSCCCFMSLLLLLALLSFQHNLITCGLKSRSSHCIIVPSSQRRLMRALHHRGYLMIAQILLPHRFTIAVSLSSHHLIVLASSHRCIVVASPHRLIIVSSSFHYPRIACHCFRYYCHCSPRPHRPPGPF